ncbi:MAG: hypothetical protein ACOYOP_06835 [Microthrixaceae bacterium]
MRVRSFVAILGAGMILALATPLGAGAAGTASLSQNPVPFAPGQTIQPVTVTWSGQAPNKLVYVDICKKLSTAPGFEPGQDCAPLSSLTPNGTPTGAGSISVDIFRGPDPGEQPWGCFAANDTAPAGIEKFTTCYVRVTNDSLFNNSAATDVAFTIVESGGVIPEAPLAILLPTLGAVVALGGFFFLRRRSALA